jgi:hypothetical protein
MELPNFLEHTWLNELRKKISAPLNVEYSGNTVWDPAGSALVNDGELWWLDIEDIWVASDGCLEYRWNDVVLYVRNQNEQWSEWAYRYHFYDCATLNSWRDNRLHNWQYVVNTFADFYINKVNYGRIVKKHIKTHLDVCKNCLKESNYKDYNGVDYTKKNFIYTHFSRDEYFYQKTQ